MKDDTPFLLALGDCNTRGTDELQAVAFPVQVAEVLQVRVVNCGHTMSTIREGCEYARRRLASNTAFLLIQFGLVDSWLTFRGAPYVLYFPDNGLRRWLRKLVKKYKKLGRRLNFEKLFGSKHVVEKAEYEERLAGIIRLAREYAPRIQICLISTAPSREEHRNPAILGFNEIMARVAREFECRYVEVYPQFIGRPELYLDAVHITREGHDIIARLCASALRNALP